MILLPTDEGGAFDILAILIVKRIKGLKTPSRDLVISAIRASIGEERFLEVIDSKNFLDLVKVNEQIFSLISAGADPVKEKNIERFKLKQEIQKQFFGSELTEDKSNLTK